MHVRVALALSLTPLALALAVAPPLDTVVVGAGVSGLRAAALLGAAGKRVCVLDAADGVGGRVRTDVVDGFQLDRGFAVFLSAYPESQAALDYDALALQNFWPGAMVQRTTDRCLIADPTRAPLSTLLPTLRFPIGTVAEKVRLSLAVLRLKLTSLEAIFAREEIDTLSHLRDRIGLGDSDLIARFFTPFLRGIYLAPLEKQSSVLFDFVLRMFADGDVALPERGIGAVAEQLADTARDAGCDIQLESAVAALRLDVGEGVHEVVLADGSALRCASVILATPPGEAARLLRSASEVPGMVGRYRSLEPASGASLASTTLYFALDGPPPVAEPVLVLNGRLDGTSINSVCFPSAVCERYAPRGRHLASVTLLGARTEGDEALVASVRAELAGWFGAEEVDAWRHLRTYVVRGAQLARPPPNVGGFNRKPRCEGVPGVYLCGDHASTPSLNGALRAGRVAAEAVLDDFS